MTDRNKRLERSTVSSQTTKQSAQSGSAPPGVAIGVAFMAVTAALVIVTAGVILAVVQHSAIVSIKELVREKAEIVSLSIVERVKKHLEPVVAQSAFTAEIISELDLTAATEETVGARLYAALAASPQVSTIALVERDYTLLRSFRNRPAVKVQKSDWSDSVAFTTMIDPAWRSTNPYWGPLFYAESADATLLNFLTPLKTGAETSHILISSVLLSDLTRFIASLQNEMTGQAFILYGREGVLAYSLLAGRPAKISDQAPLPLLSDIVGTPLSHIWSANRMRKIEADLVNDLEARVVTTDGESYVFLFRELDGFGEEPWYVGSYFTLDGLAPQLTRNSVVIAICLAIIGLGVIAALVLGRLISRPIRQLAVAADRLNHWDFDGDQRLSASIFREINEANAAFSSAAHALRSLQIYIPRHLARRLIEDSETGAIESEEHDISVLFTDIVDFTGLAERAPAAEVVRFLNSHFTLLATCIEAEQGVVDKFMGDSVMAFWGGLKTDEDHATHACRAAVRIAEAVFHENGMRRARGERPVCVRIGIHSGKAMVGNIGAPGRFNFTVVGDSVNTAQRLEALSREIGENDAEVISLISGETAMRLGPEFLISPVGRKVLHGRHVETEVFMLKSARPILGAEPATDET